MEEIEASDQKKNKKAVVGQSFNQKYNNQ